MKEIEFIIDYRGNELAGVCEYETSVSNESFSHEFGIEERRFVELEKVSDFWVEFVDGEYITKKKKKELAQYNKELGQILFDYVKERI